MKKLLHIVATPREDESRTLKVSKPFLETFLTRHKNFVWEEIRLIEETLPSLSHKRVDGKYVLLQGKNLHGELKKAWEEIVFHIDRFLSSDVIVISTPMWNFSIPYMLKHYIDIIVQPRFLFRYREDGSVEGLAKNKKMIVITSRGGDYTSDKTLDFQEPYLRGIFGFVGITDITFINTQPTDMGEEKERAALQDAIEKAKKLGMMDA